MGYSLLSAHEHEFYVVGAESKKPLHQGNLRSPLSIFADSDLLFDFADCLSEVGVDVEAIDTDLFSWPAWDNLQTSVWSPCCW